MDKEIRHLLLQLEIAENGLAMPLDRERVNELRKQLSTARKRFAEERQRKVSERLARMRAAR